MKFALPLLAVSALFLTACSTDANRRESYKPLKGDGPWTRSLEDGTWLDRETKPYGEPQGDWRARRRR